MYGPGGGDAGLAECSIIIVVEDLMQDGQIDVPTFHVLCYLKWETVEEAGRLVWGEPLREVEQEPCSGVQRASRRFQWSSTKVDPSR